VNASRPMVPRDGPDPAVDTIAPDELAEIKREVEEGVDADIIGEELVKAELEAAESGDSQELRKSTSLGNIPNGTTFEETRNSEGNGSSASDELRKSNSSGDGPNGSIHEDEIHPFGPPVNRDIRFGDLPHPRKEEEAISDTEEGLGRRTNTIENARPTHSRQDSHNRHRRTGSLAFPRAATYERVLSNAFGRRRRDESPNSRMSRRSSMTLPYFTFTPTVGRNSLFFDLTEDQRDELGGVEYRAVKTLLWVLLGKHFHTRSDERVFLWDNGIWLGLSYAMDSRI
jgi:Cation transport protein